MRMTIPEIDAYAAELRKEQFSKDKPIGAVMVRKNFSPIFRKMLMIDRMTRKQKITVLGNKPHLNTLKWEIWETVNCSRYHTKNEIEQCTVKAHLRNIRIKKNNAFLWRGSR